MTTFTERLARIERRVGEVGEHLSPDAIDAAVARYSAEPDAGQGNPSPDAFHAVLAGSRGNMAAIYAERLPPDFML